MNNEIKTIQQIHVTTLFEIIKLSILKIELKCQIKPTETWINIFYERFKDKSRTDYLINYLKNTSKNV